MGGSSTASVGLASSRPLSSELQSELERELALRSSLLLKQQSRISLLEDELEKAWLQLEQLRSQVDPAELEKRTRLPAPPAVRACCNGNTHY
eukprot:PLAT11531.2.p1 GENE.PLAT11531.2~~PLAT11531.2.p1  ORF type:complete len:103 (-),score=9.78 PLAT11531.2:24-299(-)